MALNYLLHRHQVALMRAAAAPSIEVRRTHESFAAEYATRINAMTSATGGALTTLTAE